MELYWKAASYVLIAVILSQAIKEKDIGLMLTMTATVMVGMIILSYLEPVVDFLRELSAMGDLKGETLGILLKALGIALVTQIAEMVCKDSGNSSLGHSMTILGTAAILWISLPVFRLLIQILKKILGEL